MSECSPIGRDCDDPCPPVCETAFDRVWVTHATIGGTIVEWALKQNLNDPGPFTYQLQLGRTGSNLSDDWVNVGLPVTNACLAVDDTQRLYGRTQWTHYRVRATTALATYVSPPEPVYGRMPYADWRRAREILRGWRVNLEKTPAGTKGSLLKRRLYGTACDCLDEMTYGVRNPQHETCYGTGFVGGYFDPIPCSYVEFPLKLTYNRTDDGRGTIQDGPNAWVKMLNVPQVFSGDVWVNSNTDERWVVHEINSIAELRGVPLVISCQMSLVPFKDVIYQFPMS